MLDADSLDVVEEATVLDRPTFPYVPGLFAFRELPALVEALRGSASRPTSWSATVTGSRTRNGSGWPATSAC